MVLTLVSFCLFLCCLSINFSTPIGLGVSKFRHRCNVFCSSVGLNSRFFFSRELLWLMSCWHYYFFGSSKGLTVTLSCSSILQLLYQFFSLRLYPCKHRIFRIHTPLQRFCLSIELNAGSLSWGIALTIEVWGYSVVDFLEFGGL